MNKRKKVADAKHRARARKLEEKRKALKASGGAPPPPPQAPRPAPRRPAGWAAGPGAPPGSRCGARPGPRAERHRRRPAGLTRRPATSKRCRPVARTAFAFSSGPGWLCMLDGPHTTCYSPRRVGFTARE